MKCRSYIDGQWSNRTAEAAIVLHNPADSRDVISESLHATPVDAVRAVESAVTAWHDWRRVPVADRIVIIDQLVHSVEAMTDKFANAISNETGKTLEEARQEVVASVVETRVQIDIFKNALVEEINGHRISHEPIGPVLLVTPSNFPLAAVMRKLAPALLAGNTAIVKASELTPLTAKLLFDLLDESTLLAGVVSLIIADGRSVVPAMIAVPGLAAISMTGSNKSGAAIAAEIGDRNIRFQAEMGGSNVVVVLADADLDTAAAAVVNHGFACCGQWCTGTTRVIVDSSVYVQFARTVAGLVELIIVGPGTDPSSDMGPLISAEQRYKVEEAIDILCRAGAQVLCGGHRPVDAGLERGNFLLPTVLTDIQDYESLADQEIFGPVVALVRADGVNDAFDKANAGRYGLSFSVFTRNEQVAERFVSEIDAGVCHINLPTGFRDNALPLSGWGQSGRGIPECGTFARDFFTQAKAIYRAT